MSLFTLYFSVVNNLYYSPDFQCEAHSVRQEKQVQIVNDTNSENMYYMYYNILYCIVSCQHDFQPTPREIVDFSNSLSNIIADKHVLTEF